MACAPEFPELNTFNHSAECFTERKRCQAQDPNKRSSLASRRWPRRLVTHIAQGERSVEELSARANLSFANASRHLQILRRARLVDTERRGKRVLYRLAGNNEVVDL